MIKHMASVGTALATFMITFMTIKVITFDWGDTLAANFSMPYDARQQRGIDLMANSFSEHGYLVPQEWRLNAYSQLKKLWVESIDPAVNPDHKEFDYISLLNSWFDIIDPHLPNDLNRSLQQSYFHYVSETIVAFDRVTSTLHALCDRGYTLGILSHVAWPEADCRAWFERRGWNKYVSFYSLSSTVGWIKPNPKHYQDTIRQAGCDAQQILHVGDHPLRDITGAKLHGMKTALKQTEGIYSPQDIAACEADYIIDHVDELLDYL